MLKKICRSEIPLYIKNYYAPETTDDEGIRPLRFTKKQLQLYEVEPARRVRSLCSSGAYLGFMTDSDVIKVTYNIYEHARNYAWFDLFSDGIFVNTKGKEPAVSGFNELTFETGAVKGKERSIRIYLPHVVDIAILKVEYSNGCTVRPLPERKLMLCAGDSITQGMTSKCPSCSYPVLVSEGLDMDLLNYGVGGYVFDENIIDTDAGISPSLITVAYGVNDWFRYDSIVTFSKMCSGFFARLNSTYPGIPVFVITPIWCTSEKDIKPAGNIRDIRNEIERIAGLYDSNILVDGLKMVPNMPEYFTDGVHPNDNGFMHFGLNLITIILKHLGGRI